MESRAFLLCDALLYVCNENGLIKRSPPKTVPGNKAREDALR